MSEEDKVNKPSLLGMLTSPTEQFKRIRKRPLIWGAMGILIVLFIIGSLLTSFGTIPELEVLEFDDALLADMKVLETFGILLMGILVPLIGVLLSSFIYFLVAKIAQSDVSFRQLFSMNTYITILGALSLIINGAFIALTSGNQADQLTSLGFLVNAEGPISAILNSLEVFTIWTLILTIIGLQKVAGFSKGLAWGITLGFFLLGIIFLMISSGISGQLSI